MSRRLAVAAAVVAALGIGAAAGRYVWLPRYRPALRPGEAYGIDVSHHQGTIAWDRVARDGIKVVYVKATEGGDGVDERFADNWRGAQAAGLTVGAYHFFTLCVPGAEQAANFLRTVPVGPQLTPALDLELAGNCRARPSRADVTREVTAYVDALKVRVPRVLLYVGADFADRYFGSLDGEPHWRRSPLRRPGGEWSLWQASSWAKVAGVPGGADLDVLRAPG
jgi:lysozyme